MPPREAKARMLTREYFADVDFMTSFSAVEREAYIGLALHADDAGWLDWQLAELAAVLYRYEPRETRESMLADVADHLALTGRLVRYSCGHAHMPRVAKSPRSGGREFKTTTAHEGCQIEGRPESTEVDPGQPRSTGAGGGPVLSSPVESTRVKRARVRGVHLVTDALKEGSAS